MATILSHKVLTGFFLLLAGACGRVVPKCPANAVAPGSGRPSVTNATIERFFPQPTREAAPIEMRDTFFSDLTETLAYFREAPLSSTSPTAYRVVGGSRWVLNVSVSGVVEAKSLELCEDGRGDGVTLVAYRTRISHETWEHTDRCMADNFWEAPFDGPIEVIDGQITVIEGVKPNNHHIVQRHFGGRSTAGLNECLSGVLDALGWDWSGPKVLPTTSWTHSRAVFADHGSVRTVDTQCVRTPSNSTFLNVEADETALSYPHTGVGKREADGD